MSTVRSCWECVTCGNLDIICFFSFLSSFYLLYLFFSCLLPINLVNKVDYKTLTDSHAFPARRRQYERHDGQNREDAAWNDKVDDVVESFASQPKREHHSWERNPATCVIVEGLFGHNIYNRQVSAVVDEPRDAPRLGSLVVRVSDLRLNGREFDPRPPHYRLVGTWMGGCLWDWPLTWKTVFLQCYYTVGWVIWPLKSSPKWPIMCRVGR